MRRFAQFPRLRKTLAAAAAVLLAVTAVPAGAAERVPGEMMGAQTVGAVTADVRSAVNDAATYLDITAPDGTRYVCSGTLITPVHVLTAKHCVYDTNKGEKVLENATASIGPDRTAPTDQITVSAGNVALHPAADLAVLTLDAPAQNTVAAKVWGGEVDVENTEFLASGFGTGVNSDPLPYLGEAHVDVTGKQLFTLAGVDDTRQTGYVGFPEGNARITQGDSGGPLHNHNHVFGVNSGVATGEPYTMAFVATQDYAEWIEATAPGSVDALPAPAPQLVPQPEPLPAPMPVPVSGTSAADPLSALVADIQTRVLGLLGLN